VIAPEQNIGLEEDAKMKITKRCLQLMVVVLALICALPSFADAAINYVYDDLNRLIRMEDSTNSKVTEYDYDEVGNRTHYIIKPLDLGLEPDIPGGSYNGTQTVTLECGSGGCNWGSHILG
jgi:YD repeat-containing protein